ncbi:hypothetical protein [Halorubrum tibetense]|uniref:Uncharacterized protein n=1 Tax=Halorubrum tibetense TaxID=175631 RepID=A0ABD5SCJ8_9EURY
MTVETVWEFDLLTEVRNRKPFHPNTGTLRVQTEEAITVSVQANVLRPALPDT